MMENEPPEHTRLRRAVAGAFNRGHVERLRPRVRALAASLLDEADPTSFDVIGAYAEPLPVLVIAELVGLAEADVPSLRRWSQAIVRMYEPSPSTQVVEAAVAAAQEFADLVREHLVHRRAHPGEDLTTDLLAAGLSDDELVAAVVLLLNAGHEASVNVFGNGLVALLAARAAAGRRTRRSTVEEMLRFDSALQLFERTATASVTVGRRGDRGGAEDRRAPGCRQPRPRGLRRGRPVRPGPRPRTLTWPSAPASTSASAPRSRGWSSPSPCAALLDGSQAELAGEPASRRRPSCCGGTVECPLRGHEGGGRAMAEAYDAVEVIVAKRDRRRAQRRADRLGGRRLHARRGGRRADVRAGDGDPAQRHEPPRDRAAGPPR